MAFQIILSSNSSNFFRKLLLMIVFLQVLHSTLGCYNAIFSFGDSTADTGNLIRIADGEPASQFPYGETYFHYPSGRYSDGRLIVDFIAQEMGLPLVQPYYSGNDSEIFKFGANFAVSGACAMNNEFFKSVGLDLKWNDYSLSTQLKWFEQLLLDLSAHTKTDHKEIVGKSLVIMGEMGVNDFMHFLDQGAINEMYANSPLIVSKISTTIKDLIRLGARTLMVAGMFPMGCMPKYLTMFQNASSSDQYDPNTGCLKWLNDFSEEHNKLLKLQLNRLRKLHPRVKVIYANYFEALMPAYQSPHKFGIEVTLVACCGAGGGKYNYNLNMTCGNGALTVCADPSKSISWDGSHLTEAAYEIMARAVLQTGGEEQHSYSTSCTTTPIQKNYASS